MTSRKLSYAWPASASPAHASRNPTTPKPTATAARRHARCSRMPNVRNESEAEYTLSTFAAIAPSAIDSNVNDASHPGRCEVNAVVGLSEVDPPMVADAAPTSIRIVVDRNIPEPANQPTARRLESAGR